MSDAINHPDYYNMGPWCACGEIIECIVVIRSRQFSVGSAMKYLWRAGLKQDASLSALQKEREDVAKAEWFCKDRKEELDRLIAAERANEGQD